MKVKTIIDEDFVNYKNPSMFIGTVKCDWKCCTDAGADNSMCQNSAIAKQKDIEISTDEIFRRYAENPITSAIVFGGLEPMLQFDDVFEFIQLLRNKGNNDDIVIYTGYYPGEIPYYIDRLKPFGNIIVKFGRFIANSNTKFDDVLGVNLSSENQYGVKIC